ncbi:MAG: hypothetical protein ACE5Q6_01850 [Dehalococcoidia bacterium]
MEPIFDRIAQDFGDNGLRASEMLQTAVDLIHSGSEGPRIGEAIAYCIREALTEIPRTAGVVEGEWKNLSRRVAEGRTRYEQMQGLSGMDAEQALKDLLQSIDDLEAFHSRERIHLQGLRQLLRARTGVDPLDHDANVLNDYQQLIDDIQGAVHNSVHTSPITLKKATEYYEHTLDMLRRLFLVDERLNQLLELAALANPTPEHAKILPGLLTNPHDLRYFAMNVVSPRWLFLMLDQGLLDPSPNLNAPNAAFIMIRRLRDAYAAELELWLEEAWQRWAETPEGVDALASAAFEARESGHSTLLRCLRDHPDKPTVCRFALWIYQQLDASEPIIVDIADHLLNPSAAIEPHYQENDLPEKLILGINSTNALSRVKLLVYKVRSHSSNDPFFFISDHGSIENLGRARTKDVTSVIILALFSALRLAIYLNSPSAELLATLSPLPSELHRRFQAWLLAHTEELECEDAIEFITKAINARRPNGDDILLIDRVQAVCTSLEFLDAWKQSLGSPPDPAELGITLKKDPKPEELIRRWLWSVALPDEVSVSWRDSQAILANVVGPVDRDDLLQTDNRIHFMSGPNSPFDIEYLKSHTPAEVAGLVSAWTPTTKDSWELRSARGVGRQLQVVVKEAALTWAQDAIRIVAGLKHPTYIGHYFRGLAEGADQVDGPGDSIVQAIDLVRTEPWPTVVLGGDDFDYDPDWSEANRAGIQLIKALATNQVDFGSEAAERAWSLSIEAARDRSKESGVGGEDADLLTSAINRPCTEALETVITLIEYVHRRSGTIPNAAFELLTDSLKLDGRDGAEHRAILSPRIPFLRYVLPQWFEENLDLFLGESAPTGLAQVSVDLWLRWNRADRWLLENFQFSVIDAVRRSAEGALEGFLLGMFWRVPGYDVPYCVATLAELGSQAVSRSGEETAQMLRHDDTPEGAIELGISFWRETLQKAVSAEGFHGFGWWTEVTKLQDDLWEELTLATCQKADGYLDRAPHVAERAATRPASASALRILTYLVISRLEYWENALVADHAMDALRASSSHEDLKDIRSDLRRALLEHGYFGAGDIE